MKNILFLHLVDAITWYTLNYTKNVVLLLKREREREREREL